DFTKGAGLDQTQIDYVLSVVFHQPGIDVGEGEGSRVDAWNEAGAKEPLLKAGFAELTEIEQLVRASGYGANRIQVSPAIVRGLEYYTGPVFEAELTFEVKDEKGHPVRFGSVGGGGRYDDLVARFTGQKVPATGFSIGVSRLRAALAHLNKDKAPAAEGPVIVTVMEKDRIADYQKLVQTLRNAGIRAELYLGNPKKFGKQLEYADKRRSPCVVIQGSNERDANPPQVILKDMIEGAKAAAAIADNKEWKETRPAQVSVKEADLVAEVRKILARHAP
ncbi:MAG: ATP phosphoribosyltransferase regulatory subunit, partial [Hyphomicrobium sp.]